MCGYRLCGHSVRAGVTCPECGGAWHRDELQDVARRCGRFRQWMAPVFLLPAAAVVGLDRYAGIGWRDEAMVPVVVFIVLLAMTYFAARNERGIERVGTAVVLAEFLWLTSGLLARFLPICAL